MTTKDVKASYSVLIIGCGEIAGGYDLNNPSTSNSLSHAAAFNKHKDFFLKGCVDPEINKLKKFKSKWKFKQTFTSIKEIEEKENSFDVISICSPKELHQEQLEFALKIKPKIVFCEKPFTTDHKLAEKMAYKFKKKNISLCVNYSRRWDEQTSIFRKELKRGEWGKLQSVIGTYNKGILNNGSHLIDLLIMFFGSLRVEWVGKQNFDFWEDDPSISAILKTKDDNEIHLNAVDSNYFTIFEIKFITEKGVISVEDSGMSWRIQQTKKSSLYKNYTVLDKSTFYKGSYTSCMDNAVDNIFPGIEFC